MSDVAPLNLQDLQADLQTQLEAEYFPTDPIQVRCLFKEGLLLVLVQHQAPAPAELPPLFRLIRDRLQGDPRVQGHQTLIYLRITGANEPYAFHALTQFEVEPVFDGQSQKMRRISLNNLNFQKILTSKLRMILFRSWAMS